MNNKNEALKTKICHISSVHPYFDTRVFYKECRSLANAGYDVCLVARKEDGIATRKDGVEIVPFREYSNRFKRVLFSSWRMFSVARQQNALSYHFHDPELLTVGILLKLIGKKVIYDVHEDYSDQLLHKSWLKSRVLKWIIARGFRVFEVCASWFFDRIVTVTDDIAAFFPARKTVVVRNLPMLKVIEDAEPYTFTREKPVIIYAGALGRVRGVKEIVQMAGFLKHDAELWLLGKWESETYRHECMAQKGWEKVKYMGLKKPDEVYCYMKAADIGLTMLHPIKNYMVGLPVKTFEYLACGAPLVISNFPYWQSLFSGCAEFADPLNPENIAQKIDGLLDNPDERNRQREAGLNLVQTLYSWEAESLRLVELYQSLFPIK